MNTVDEAWDWFEKTKGQLQLIARLGATYWSSLPWAGPLGRDERFRHKEGEAVAGDSAFCIAPLDDLAVLVLFSIFESSVRDKVLSRIETGRSRVEEPQIHSIIDEALEGIRSGSFFRVLKLFKLPEDQQVEGINQVRRYRNWVAHGRRTKRPEAVTPQVAYDRLKRFLTRLDEIDADPAPEPRPTC